MRAIVIALVLVIAGSQVAVAADLGTAAQRAAYCSAVLEYSLETFALAQPDASDNVCRGWWQKDFSSIEACTSALQGNIIKEFRQKLDRYDSYLRAELARSLIANRDNDQAKRAVLFSVAVIKRKGRSDAEATKTGPPSAHLAHCTKKCGSDFRCHVDCVAEQLPTDASVLRCALLPDELPY